MIWHDLCQKIKLITFLLDKIGPPPETRGRCRPVTSPGFWGRGQTQLGRRSPGVGRNTADGHWKPGDGAGPMGAGIPVPEGVEVLHARGGGDGEQEVAGLGVGVGRLELDPAEGEASLVEQVGEVTEAEERPENVALLQGGGASALEE